MHNPPSQNASSIRLCCLIPVYNHHQKIRDLVKQLLGFHLPIILIDDGSEPITAATLDQLSQEFDSITLIRHTINQGKGVAVCTGFIKAYQLNYTHVLQVDADGQHDLNDIPQFIAYNLKFPEKIICGMRDYKQMPKSRRSGRKLTDFWVKINTWSSDLKDSMCGYRLYPLQSTVDLIQTTRIGKRMDFDTDILVRLYWRGLSIENIPTNIIYHDDVPSHFDIVFDNVRISWMHTKLFFGMLWHSPKLLARLLNKN